uniref:ras-related and estrogen-regulated growth inhibitor-like isoform X2 n=1 Tax=Myxine glutinosa TaxID=7769 RepID=UPI00358F08E0
MSGLVPRHGRLRVLVLGQSCVGKTAMIVRFLTGRFIGDYDPTLETVYKHSIKIDGDLVDFEIFDTAKEDLRVNNITGEDSTVAINFSLLAITDYLYLDILKSFSTRQCNI